MLFFTKKRNTMDGHENHEISLSEAAALTARYRQHIGTDQIKGGFFGRDALIAILDQENCIGIRYYYGLDDNNKQVMVLVGVDAEEQDIINGELAERSLMCPPYCGDNNELNS
jgi:hypothetical protein